VSSAGQASAPLSIVNISQDLLVTFTISLLVTGLFSKLDVESYCSNFNLKGKVLGNNAHSQVFNVSVTAAALIQAKNCHCARLVVL
jgi:hypothetical protein